MQIIFYHYKLCEEGRPLSVVVRNIDTKGDCMKPIDPLTANDLSQLQVSINASNATMGKINSTIRKKISPKAHHQQQLIKKKKKEKESKKERKKERKKEIKSKKQKNGRDKERKKKQKRKNIMLKLSPKSM